MFSAAVHVSCQTKTLGLRSLHELAEFISRCEVKSVAIAKFSSCTCHGEHSSLHVYKRSMSISIPQTPTQGWKNHRIVIHVSFSSMTGQSVQEPTQKGGRKIQGKQFEYTWAREECFTPITARPAFTSVIVLQPSLEAIQSENLLPVLRFLSRDIKRNRNSRAR